MKSYLVTNKFTSERERESGHEMDIDQLKDKNYKPNYYNN